MHACFFNNENIEYEGKGAENEEIQKQENKELPVQRGEFNSTKHQFTIRFENTSEVS